MCAFRFSISGFIGFGYFMSGYRLTMGEVLSACRLTVCSGQTSRISELVAIFSMFIISAFKLIYLLNPALASTTNSTGGSIIGVVFMSVPFDLGLVMLLDLKFQLFF